ncbi:MAG: hydrogenase expression/formation protein HypE [Anaerolinea sp.]|nr:hydrogenase expression/formation protein HypE [Anaerolinea sp.]
MSTSEKINLSGWTCPAPLRNYPQVVMGHGSGGKMMADLIGHLFKPLLDNPLLGQMGDSTTFILEQGGRLAFTTDSFVISPIFFPGGSIGELAVNGTINDLAMSGAIPLYLSAAFILEEGLPMTDLGRIVSAFSAAAAAASVQVIAGDTKVVNKGHGDGLYITTTGIGLVPAGIEIAPHRAQPGDAILVSGTMGDHGVAIMSVREGLAFESPIVSDTAPLHGLVQAMITACPNIHCLRDATRGGLAAVLNELAGASSVGIEFGEGRIPVNPAVHGACEMLGLDPLHVANEGKLVAILPRADAEKVLAVMRAHPMGAQAAIIGEVVESHPGMVIARTAIGGTRIVDLPAGELLPRIC